MLDNRTSVEIFTKKGRTPLHRAADESQVGLAKLLLDREAHVNRHDAEDSTSLSRAAWSARIAS